MLSAVVQSDPFAALLGVPIVGQTLHDIAVKAKNGAESELKRRLTPPFIAAFALGGLGVVLGAVALIRTRKARR